MSQRLPRPMGLLAAKEMMLSGGVIGGEETVAMDLANRCVAAGELLQGACLGAEK